MRRFASRWTAAAGAAALAAATVALTAMPATATTGDFANGSFNGSTTLTSSFETLGRSSTAIDPWVVTLNTVDLVSTYWAPPTYTTSDGNYYGYTIDMNGSTTPGNGAIAQTFSTVGNASYSVQFLLSANPQAGTSACPDLSSVTLWANASSSGPTYSGTGQPYTVPTNPIFNYVGGVTNPDMTWATEDYTFMATSPTTTLSFAADASNQSYCGPVLADVTVTPTNPTGAECKDGGWSNMVDPSNGYLPFKNQGDCVSYYAISGATPIGS